MIEFGSSHILASPFPELVKGQSGKDENTKTARLVGKPNPNVILLSFNKLSEDIDVVTGDATVCSQCSAILNRGSNFKNEKEIWTCEFCGNVTEIKLEPEEVPKAEPLSFLIEGKPEVKSKKEETKKAVSEDDSIVIFCIDTSGSMSTTTEVKANFIINGKKKQHVTRLEFVQAAVNSQINKMKTEFPNRRVGIVSFSSAVTIWGDGTNKPIKITGNQLNDYSQLLENAEKFSLERPISQTCAGIEKIVSDLTESGSTALGPALVTSVVMASSKPGSKCIVCTDGLANVGIGSLDENVDTDIYQQVGHFAKKKGTVISVISIKGAQTKLEHLGSLSDLTSGAVDLVDPNNLDFGNFLKSSVIATNCVVTAILHRDFMFRSADPEDEGKILKKVSRQIGNVTDETNFTLEFGLVKGAEKTPNEVPFQIQIQYTTLTGCVYKRVVTETRKVTTDRKLAVQNLDIRIVSANLAQFSAKLAQLGHYEAALDNATHVKEMVESVKETPDNSILFEIFRAEYKKIGEELNSAISMESSSGIGSSYESRKNNRSDNAAKMLYNYKASNKAGCLIQ